MPEKKDPIQLVLAAMGELAKNCGDHDLARVKGRSHAAWTILMELRGLLGQPQPGTGRVSLSPRIRAAIQAGAALGKEVARGAA